MTAAISLQTVLSRFMDDQRLSPRQGQVVAHIQACRTPALGGQALHCDHCDYANVLYHACRDRHGPHCQQRASKRWCERQQAAVLPVTYYHLVFTLPHTLNRWVELHPEVLYRLLFQSVWATLKRFAADPKRLGGELGMTAVLHTWGQTLTRHVHLHCLIPGGVLNPQGQWNRAKSTYLFPVRALSRHVRGYMVSALRAAAHRGELSRITRPGDIDQTLDTLMQEDWVVYSKPCVSHTDTVVAYLARYSHRIAINEHRLVAMDEERVAFRYKAYRDGGKQKVLWLSGVEFIRRFLLHVLPKGLMRIRHFGFLANRCRITKLDRIRAALTRPAEKPAELDKAVTWPEERFPCPHCLLGSLCVTCLRWRP